MSMGPSHFRDDFKVSKVDQAKSSITKAVRNPIRPIFYCGLIAVFFGSIAGVRFSWQVYIILTALAFTNAFLFIKNTEDKTSKKT